MSHDEPVDYEDLTTMKLDDAALHELLAAGGECIFNWTTRAGHPVGVVVAFVYHDGKFFTTCAERRKRVPALRERPQSGIVINNGGKTASFKGESVVHAHGDPGFDELKGWFYRKLSRVDQSPDDPYRQSFATFLDSPHRVIIETDARLVVAFDTAKFQAFTLEAMAAGAASDAVVKFGLAFASSIAVGHDSAREICQRAEAAGFESLWGGEHVILPSTIDSRYPYTADGKIPAEPDTPIPDPLIWLAFAAAAAPTMRLGTCILIVPQRNPLVLAKELATLDQLSGGRVELGLGVGWLREEFDALGVPWERRGARNDEYIEAMRALWAGPHAEFHGDFVDFEPVTCSPRPIQDRIPILVGGDSAAAIARAVRLADGYFPGEGDVERLRLLVERVRTGAEAAGRDPASIGINAMFGAHMRNPQAGVEELRAIGVDRIMVPAFAFAGSAGLDRLSEFGEQVIAHAG